MSGCAFCTDRDVREREIARDALAFAFPTNIPIVPGHILVCPVRHVNVFADLRDDERAAVFALSERIKGALTKLYEAEGFHEPLFWSQ